MADQELVLLEEVAGAAQAEILRGLLEAQDIHVLLSQESAGSSMIPVTFGILGDVKIMVRKVDYDRAQEVLNAYYAGDYERGDFSLDTDDLEDEVEP